MKIEISGGLSIRIRSLVDTRCAPKASSIYGKLIYSFILLLNAVKEIGLNIIGWITVFLIVLRLM